MITQQELKERVFYDPLTGDFTWNVADRKWFKSEGSWKRWNTRYSGKPAFIGIDREGYRCGSVAKVKTFAHRFAWFYVHGIWPDQIDHINHKTSDNRLINLRNVTRSMNQKNLSKRKDNTTGYPGVHKDKQKFFARIYQKGKRIHLGTFDTFEEAKKAKMEAEVRYGFHPNHSS